MHFLKLLMLFICISIFTSCAQRIDQSADIQAVKEVHTKWVEAIKSLNADAIIALWEENGVLMRGEQSEIIGIENLRKDFEFFTTVNIEDVSIEVHEIVVSGDLAYVRQTFKAKWIPQGEGDILNENSKEIMIFRRQLDKLWKISRYIWNSNPS